MEANPEETASGNNYSQKNRSESNTWMVTTGKQMQKIQLSACTDGAYRNIEQSQGFYPKGSPMDETKVMSRKEIQWTFIEILLGRRECFTVRFVSL